MDPLGHVKPFISYLEDLPARRQKIIIFREMVIALIVILFFNFVGDHIFHLLQITQVTVYISSAIILFLVAIKILFSRDNLWEKKKAGDEPYLVPLAIPMIAGPALLATVMLYAATEKEIHMLTAIMISWILSSIILLSSRTLVRLFGQSGLTACEKLMGMILVLLSIQRFLEGIVLFNDQLKP
jgi:multiple antibiotic resistance protein